MITTQFFIKYSLNNDLVVLEQTLICSTKTQVIERIDLHVQ